MIPKNEKLFFFYIQFGAENEFYWLLSSSYYDMTQFDQTCFDFNPMWLMQHHPRTWQNISILSA
jgi:hypothetical protein